MGLEAAPLCQWLYAGRETKARILDLIDDAPPWQVVAEPKLAVRRVVRGA